LDSAKENGSAVTIPKEFERFDETEDFGVWIRRPVKHQSLERCHKDAMAESKKFAESFASKIESSIDFEIGR
jgi:hypothetical protein